MKVWNEAPSKQDVEALIRTFFEKLQAGSLNDAGNMVTHLFEDWDASVFTLWEETYQIHEIPEDDSFEGNEWKQAAWLADLKIAGAMEWQRATEVDASPVEDGDRIYVGLMYRDEVINHVGEFVITQSDGGFGVARHSIQIG